MPKDQHDLFETQHSDDATTTAYAKPPEKRPAKTKARENESVGRMVTEASEHWRAGVCEGAAMFRKRALDWLSENTQGDPGDFDVLACIGAVDETFRRQFGAEYQRQLDRRTHA